MRTGFGLAAGPCLLSQLPWVSCGDACNWGLQRGKIQLGCSHLSGWKAIMVWFLSTMESSWGKKSVISELQLFPFPPPHYSSLPSSCWSVQSRRGTDLILSHSMIVFGALYFYYIPWNISLRRNGVALIVKKSPKCSTWVKSQKQQNDLCLIPRQTI